MCTTELECLQSIEENTYEINQNLILYNSDLVTGLNSQELAFQESLFNVVFFLFFCYLFYKLVSSTSLFWYNFFSRFKNKKNVKTQS